MLLQWGRSGVSLSGGLNLFFLLPRYNCKRHECFANQPLVFVPYVAIHYAGTSSLTKHVGVRPDFAMLDGLKKIDFHFDGNHARSYWRGQKGGESPSRIGQHCQNSSVNHPVNLLVQFQHWHAKNRMASLGLFQHKTEVVDGIAVAQTFHRSRQCRLT
jgi:hypothetical protein